MATTERVDNCPGCIEGSGAEIGDWMRRQATGFGLQWANATVTEARLAEAVKVITADEGDLRARAVIIASGARPRRLGVPGEEDLWGRGVSPCATCDGPFVQGETVAVVGGGDSAVKEADYLTRFAENRASFVVRGVSEAFHAVSGWGTMELVHSGQGTDQSAGQRDFSAAWPDSDRRS